MQIAFHRWQNGFCMLKNSWDMMILKSLIFWWYSNWPTFQREDTPSVGRCFTKENFEIFFLHFSTNWTILSIFRATYFFWKFFEKRTFLKNSYLSNPKSYRNDFYIFGKQFVSPTTFIKSFLSTEVVFVLSPSVKV